MLHRDHTPRSRPLGLPSQGTAIFQSRLTQILWGQIFYAVFFLLFFSPLWSTPSLVAAQSPLLRAEVEPTSGTLSDTFKFSVTLENVDIGSARPQLEGGENFEVQFVGPQSSVFISNGSISRQISFVYQLRAKKTGQLETPAVTILVSGRAFSAPSFPVTITTGAGAKDTTSQTSVQQSVTPESAYVGQQVVNSITLFMRTGLMNPRISDLSYQEFWVEEFPEEQRVSRMLQGQSVKTISVRRALFALKAGEFVLPPRELQAKIRVGTRGRAPNFPGLDRGIFDDLFTSYELRDLRLQTNPARLVIKPLPLTVPDISNWGLKAPLVGHTTLKVSVPVPVASVGESIDLFLDIESTGNLKVLRETPLVSTPAYKVYPGKPEESVVENRGQLVFRKRFRIGIVPLQGGALSLPSITLPYFDPNSETYKEGNTSPIRLLISGKPATQDATPLVHSTPQPINPTLPAEPVPDDPLLRYEPPSRIEKLTENFSSALLALWSVSALCLLILIGFWLTRAPKAKPSSVPSGPLPRSGSETELLDAIEALLLSRYQVDRRKLGTDGVKLFLQNAGSPVENIFLVVAVLDLISELELGSPTPERRGELVGALYETYEQLRKQL